MIEKLKIGAVSCMMNRANVHPFYNLISVLYGVTENVSAINICTKNITPKQLNLCKNYVIYHKYHESSLKKIGYFLQTQLEVTFKIISLKDVNIWIFYIGDGMILPILAAKILRRKTFLLLGGHLESELASHTSKLYYIALIFKKINLKLVDNIILYSPKLIKDWNLEKYKDKIVFAHEHYINFSKFCLTKEYFLRSNLVGYIGRFSNEKGVLNLLQSIPYLVEKDIDIQFLVIGDGPLRNDIGLFLADNNLEGHVKLIKWVDHDELPTYLNELKLLVLPSYTEGLPNIMLESMACGTPVLATPVGTIPDIIKDEKNGFIMENNSKKIIERNILRALENTNINEISNNARNYVQRNFSYETAVNDFKEIVT